MQICKVKKDRNVREHNRLDTIIWMEHNSLFSVYTVFLPACKASLFILAIQCVYINKTKMNIQRKAKDK